MNNQPGRSSLTKALVIFIAIVLIGAIGIYSFSYALCRGEDTLLTRYGLETLDEVDAFVRAQFGGVSQNDVEAYMLSEGSHCSEVEPEPDAQHNAALVCWIDIHNPSFDNGPDGIIGCWSSIGTARNLRLTFVFYQDTLQDFDLEIFGTGV